MVKRKSGIKRGGIVKGDGFFGDMFEGIKKVGSFVNDIAKKTGIVSKLATATGNPIAGTIAGALGYGKRRRKKTGGKLAVIRKKVF